MGFRDDIWLLLGALLGALVALAIPYAINVVARHLRKPGIRSPHTEISSRFEKPRL